MSDFIILSLARSASTALRETLNTHEDIICHGELFGEKNIWGISNKINPSGVGIYDRIYRKQKFTESIFPSSYSKKFGCNFLFHHMFDPNNFQYIDDFFGNGTKVILLWRKDLVSRFKSDFLFRFERGFKTEQDIENLSPDIIRFDCQKQKLMLKNLRTLYLDAIPSEKLMQIDFESLISDEGILNDIQNFIGVTPAIKSLINKKSSRPTSNFLLNRRINKKFADIKRQLSGFSDVPL